MSSSFDKLSTEILQYIIELLANNYECLRTCRLVCKRWQPLAEKHLFSVLVLDGPQEPDHVKHCSFLSKPRRCKMVKTLTYNLESYGFLEDDFFELFPNIEEVHISTFFMEGWEPFYKTFTPERCRLRILPDLMGLDKFYYKTALNFSDTLEEIYLNDEFYNTKKMIDNAHLFKRLKKLSLDAFFRDLQELDEVLEAYAFVRYLTVLPCCRVISGKWTPPIRRKQQMQFVSIDCQVSAGNRAFAIYDYFAYKYPNVIEWRVGTEDEYAVPEENDGETVSYEQLVHRICQFLESPMLTMVIHTEYAPAEKTIEYFLLPEAASKIFGITYDSVVGNLDEEDEQARNLEFVDISIRKGNPEPLYKIATSQCIIMKAAPITICITSPQPRHLQLLERLGSSLKELSIDTRAAPDLEDGSRYFPIPYGGGLIHAIDHCTQLKSLSYTCNKLLDVIYDQPYILHSNINTLYLTAEFINGRALRDVCRRLPNLKNLYFGSSQPFRDGSGYVINLISRQLDYLGLHNASLKKGQESTPSCVLFYIVLTGANKTIISKYNMLDRQVQEISELEFIQSKYVTFKILCDSVKNIVFTDEDKGTSKYYYKIQ